MKQLIKWLPVFALLLTACEKETVTPSGNITQVTHPFYFDYYQVQVSDGIQYTITPSDSDKVVIETDDNIQSEIQAKQIGNIIYLSKKKGNNVDWNRTTVKAHLFTTQTLTSIQGESGSAGSCDMSLYGLGGLMKIVLSGGSTFTSAVNVAAAGSLWLELSDGSTANLSGSANEVRLLSESGSTLNAYDMSTNNLILQIFSGGSKAYMTVNEKIFAVDAKGGSMLYYKGAGVLNPGSSFSEGSAAVHVD